MDGFIIVLALIGFVIAGFVGWFAMLVFSGFIIGIPLILIGLWALTSWGNMAGLGLIPIIIGGLCIYGNFDGN